MTRLSAVSRPLHLVAVACLSGLLGAMSCSYDQGGVVYVPPPNAERNLGCNGECHGDDYSNAPPNDLEGGTEIGLVGVGAHRAHLNASPGWHLKIDCADCHQVPTDVTDLGHIDGDQRAELTFSARATGNGMAETTWESLQCRNAYCHGSTTTGGAVTTPMWTEVRQQPLACNSCHGFPPPPPHDAETNCSGCHPTVRDVDNPTADDFVSPNSHINGVVDTAVGQPKCDSCHGSGGVWAPPDDLSDNTDVSAPGVGAHRAHVTGASDWRRVLTCDQCHTTVIGIDDAHHMDGTPGAEVTFDGTNPDASYDPNAVRCNNLYCHSNGAGQLASVVWNQGGLNLRGDCTACHNDDGNNMTGRHALHLQSQEMAIECSDCHFRVIDPQRNFLDPSLHINGNHEVDMRDNMGSWSLANQRCQNGPCHNGNKKWIPNGNNDDDDDDGDDGDDGD